MTYSDLLNLALGNLGTLVVLIVAVVALARGWIVPAAQLTRERERTDRVDAQADRMLDIQNQILTRLTLQDEKEKWRREGP